MIHNQGSPVMLVVFGATLKVDCCHNFLRVEREFTLNLLVSLVIERYSLLQAPNGLRDSEQEVVMMPTG